MVGLSARWCAGPDGGGCAVLTIARLKRWGINYYNRTAQDAVDQMKDRAAAGGGLGDYYSEAETRVPTWMVTGDAARVGESVGLSAQQLDGGVADPEVVARWSDDGAAPNGLMGRVLTEDSVHAFDCTIAAPKSVSLIRALIDDPTTEKIVGAANKVAAQAAFDYLGRHAGYTRVYNRATGKAELQKLPGLVGIAYQHETSRAGDPHLHVHVIVPNRQARADGKLVSIDSKSLHHEAKAAGMIYQAVLRRELARDGFEWEHVGEHTGMAELAGVTKADIKAWSRRSTRLRQWAAGNLRVVEDSLTARQLAAAQRATRPDKPESLSWAALKQMWRDDARGFVLDGGAWARAREQRKKLEKTYLGVDWRRLTEAAASIPKAGFTRADMVELMAAQWPTNGDGDVLAGIEAAVDEVSTRISQPRQAHLREGSERFTIDLVIVEEKQIFSMLDKFDWRAKTPLAESELAGLSEDQAAAVSAIGDSTQLVHVLQAPAGAGKTHSLKALRRAANRIGKDVYVFAPTGKAVDEAMAEQAGDHGHTVAKALKMITDRRLTLDHESVVVVDEASMLATPDLHKLMSATTRARAKLLLVGDQHQLGPVLARGGMFEQLCTDLPWAQELKQVWRFRDPEEKDASLDLRNADGRELRQAVDWYSDHDRLSIGDPLAMAEGVFGAYLGDRVEGKDALIICDTREMADAMNTRLHKALLGTAEQRSAVVGGDVRVKVARDQQVAVGDVILSRDNDASIDCVLPDGSPADQVRNGNRWTVVGFDTERDVMYAIRGGNGMKGDGARATFDREYFAEHITLGYATTVHAAQGVTAETCHSLIGATTSRTMAYVAMTRGREANKAYLYERFTGELDHEHTSATGTDEIHILKRGTPESARRAFYTLLDTNDDRPTTMHAIAAKTPREHLPERIVSLLAEHARNQTERIQHHTRWLEHQREYRRALRAERKRAERALRKSRSRGYDNDLGFDL